MSGTWVDIKNALPGTRPATTRAEAGARVGVEYWLLAAVVVLEVAINWHFASRSYFVTDDLVQFESARHHALTAAFLLNPQLGTFSPGSSLATWLIQHHATFDFGLAVAFLLTLHSVGVVLLQRILRLCFGPAWWTYVAAFAYGISFLPMTSFNYFSAGILRIPVAAMSIAAMHAYLCWRRTGRTAWLAWSVACVVIALFFRFEGALIVLYILLMRLLLLDRVAVRDFPRTIAREWRIWALYAAPLVVYAAVAFSRSGLEPWRTTPFGDVSSFLRISWIDVFVPGLFGIRVTHESAPLVHSWVVALCNIALIAAVAVSVRRRRSAWRAWAFLAIPFVVNGVLLMPRYKSWGLHLIAESLRYYVILLPLVPIAVAFAFSRGRPESAPVSSPRSPKPKVAAAVAVALAAYVGLTLAADSAVDNKSGQFARKWIGNARADLGNLRRAGSHPVVLDKQIPPQMLEFWVQPGANKVSEVLPLLASDVRFDEVSAQTFEVQDSGHLRPVAYRMTVGGAAADLARRGQLVVRGVKGELRAGSLCVPATHRWTSVEYLPPYVLQGHEWYLQSTYRTSPGGSMFLAVNRGIPYPAKYDRGLPARPGGGTELTEIGVLPGATRPAFGRFRIDIPPGRSACFDRFAVGWYAPRA